MSTNHTDLTSSILSALTDAPVRSSVLAEAIDHPPLAVSACLNGLNWAGRVRLVYVPDGGNAGGLVLGWSRLHSV